MSAVATPTRPRLKRAETAPSPQAVNQKQSAQLPLANINTIQHRLLIATSLLELLIFNLDDELGQDAPGSGDVMGILQHTDLLLHEANQQIRSFAGVLPDDLRGRIFEASAIVAVVQRMTFGSCWSRNGYDNSMLIACFDAAADCIQRALRALETTEAYRA